MYKVKIIKSSIVKFIIVWNFYILRSIFADASAYWQECHREPRSSSMHHFSYRRTANAKEEMAQWVVAQFTDDTDFFHPDNKPLFQKSGWCWRHIYIYIGKRFPSKICLVWQASGVSVTRNGDCSWKKKYFSSWVDGVLFNDEKKKGKRAKEQKLWDYLVHETILW